MTRIVLLTHRGYTADEAMAAALEGVDVIVGGDSHSLLAARSLTEIGLSPAGPSPTIVTRSDGSTVCVVQAWEYAHAVGNLLVTFDAAGGVVSCSGEPVIPIGSTFTAKVRRSVTP